ncbi:hypothetical protein Ddc_09809 [Ditylenchus destructor]|nr:hypothetical protein Ddc_09809 [Ditylenchus destructor]
MPSAEEKRKAHEERLRELIKLQMKPAAEAQKMRQERNDVKAALFGKKKETKMEAPVFTDEDFAKIQRKK